MDGLNSYERLVTAALLASLGLCTALAGVKFFRNRAKTLSILLRAQGALFALLFGSMATIAVIDGTAKTQRPWASALDFACLTAKGARSANAALTAITQKLFSGMGFEYDTMWGTTQYYDSEEKSFKLSEYLSDEGGVVNCYDQALGVVSLGNVLGTESHVVAVVPLGYVEVGELVGVGRCNNPLYTGPERWRRRCRIEGEVTTRVVYVPRSPMASEDTIDRSMFDSHGFVVSDGLVFDACVGPFCGELDATNYLNQVVDQTTEDERLNGFFAPDRGGRIINESPVFKMR